MRVSITDRLTAYAIKIKTLPICENGLQVDMAEGQSMNKPMKDIAMLFGSKETYKNDQLQALKEFITLLCDHDCDDMLRLTGIRALRSVK